MNSLESVSALTARHPPDPNAKLQRAAKDFEALLIEQMLRSAREALADESDDDAPVDPNSSLQELSEQQLAQSLANAGGLGIAKMVLAGLTHDANR